LTGIWDGLTVETVKDSTDALSDGPFPLDHIFIYSFAAISNRRQRALIGYPLKLE
jgi:hypothetical protein